MIREKSCGAVVFDQSGEMIRYLLLKHKNGGHWGFPKGHVEAGETEETETALREIYEEAGIKVNLKKGFRYGVEYSPYEGAWKQVIYFIGEAIQTKVNCQREEIGEYCWAEYETALKLLEHENNRALLKNAHHFLLHESGAENK